MTYWKLYVVNTQKTRLDKTAPLSTQNTYEPRHEISNNVVCATSKASDTRSLIRTFASRLNIFMTVKLL